MENQDTSPRQLGSATVVVVSIELLLAVWAFIRLRYHWPADSAEATGPFWASLAALLFLVGLVLTNLVGMWQTLRGGRVSASSGDLLPVRLTAVNGTNPEVATGLAPLSLAFLAPAYPLFRMAVANLYDFGLLWVGACLVCVVVGIGMALLIARQIYLMAQGAETAVEVSAANVSPGQSVQVAVMHKPGRTATQQAIGCLVCRQTTRETYIHNGQSRDRYETAVSHKQHLCTLSPTTNWEQQTQTTIPIDASFSTEDGNNYPQVNWMIEVAVKIANAPDYCLEFPIQVVGTPSLVSSSS